MKVNCVIVTYNRLALLKECLAAIEKQTYPIHKVIVIDNCSTDGTEEYLKAYAVHPQFQVIRTEQNIGGAGGFSLGVKTSVLGGGDYTWMMDDDTIPSPKALEALMQTATQSNDIGFVCQQSTLDRQYPSSPQYTRRTKKGHHRKQRYHGLPLRSLYFRICFGQQSCGLQGWLAHQRVLYLVR